MSKKTNNPDFSICDGKGFRITFENGWTISVQFGPGNYCDNYNMSFMPDPKEASRTAGENGSTTAECAVLNPSGSLVDLPKRFAENDQVTNRSTPAEVLDLMKWTAKRPVPVVDSTRDAMDIVKEATL